MIPTSRWVPAYPPTCDKSDDNMHRWELTYREPLGSRLFCKLCEVEA